MSAMHPSWTPESRAAFEAGIDRLLLQMTPLDKIVERILEIKPNGGE